MKDIGMELAYRPIGRSLSNTQTLLFTLTVREVD